MGFLPSSSNKSHLEIYYMARSLRIALPRLEFKKNRRYEIRKFVDSGISFSFDSIGEAQKNVLREQWPKISNWMHKRFGSAYLDENRFERILNFSHLSHLLIASIDEKPVGFALINNDDYAAHYWYSFYDVDITGLGQNLMAKFLLWAQQRQIPYAYLGTIYTPKARYKIKGIRNGIEFWEGSFWSSDKTELEERIKLD